MRAVLVAALLAAAPVAAEPAAAPARADRGWQAFRDVESVLRSPRCLSCHLADDAPLQGDDGHRHAMNVKRGADGRGTPALHCTACHQSANNEAPHAPPGAPDWRLPPPNMPMAWQGLGSEALCDSLKDPARNGGRSLAALEEHLRKDAIVGWGFHPGPGRQPPPLSRDELVARFVVWRAAGAPCRPARSSDARGSHSGGIDRRGVDRRGMEARGPNPGGVDARGTEARGMKARATEARGMKARGTEARGMKARGMKARGKKARGKKARGPHAR